MLENEKYWNKPSIYEYNIMRCTVSCWLLKEHDDREWISNGGLSRLKHDIYRSEIYLNILLKNKGQEDKIVIFQEWVPVGGRRAKEKGGYILYSYVKIEEWNLLRLI
jgi:hypothetical protein